MKRTQSTIISQWVRSVSRHVQACPALDITGNPLEAKR